MRVLVLTELRVFRRHADVGDKKKLVRHIPGVAMHRDNQGLRERRLGAPERVDKAGSIHHFFSGLSEGLVGIDIDTSGEAIAIAEQNSGTEGGIAVIIVVGSRQALCRVRVQSVVDVGPVDANQRCLAFALDGDLGSLIVRNIRHARGLRGLVAL
ncbi:O-acetylhomoserine/O-acetylserine sulfhydrylase-like pyridoxal-dependent enzyme [Bradyrhizobium sp. LB9.1b]